MGRSEQQTGGVAPSTGDPRHLLTRRRFLSAAGLCTAGFTFYAGEIGRHATEVVPRTIHIANLPDAFHGMRIVQLSDIHYDNFSEPSFVRHAIQKINALAPDMVLLTGDYISKGPTTHAINESHAQLCAAILKEIACPQRYAILGNHDVTVGAKMVTAALVENGIPVLSDTYVPLDRGSQRIWLVGLHDAGAAGAIPDLQAAMPPAQPKEPILLMIHEPDYTDILLASPLGAKTDLILSGHSHGGQIRLPLLGACYVPPLGRKYINGLFSFPRNEKTVQLYVNRGLGTVGLPLRYNCPPEITLITLSAEPV